MTNDRTYLSIRINILVGSGVAGGFGARRQTSSEAPQPPPVLVISYPQLFVIDRTASFTIIFTITALLS